MLTFQEMRKSFRSLLIHRLRTFLSTLGILFGVAAVIAMLSIGEGAKQETLEQIQQLGMNSILIRKHVLPEEQTMARLTGRDVEALSQNVPSLLRCAPLKVVEASMTGSSVQMTPEILAVTREYGELKALRLAEGRFICDLDQHGKGLVCVLGYEIARSLGKEGHVGKTIRLDNSRFEIVGILNPTHWKPGKNAAMTARNLDQAVLIPLGSERMLLKGLQIAKESLSEIILQVRDPRQMGMAVPLVKKIMARLHSGSEDYQLIIPQELLQQAARTQRTFNLVLGSIAAISLLVGGIGIMNIMLATVWERTREIGIRRAVGASQRHILRQFLLETILLTLTGALCGVVLGIGASLSINYFAGWHTIVTLWSVLLSLVMSLAVGLSSGLYPAYQAARMDPVRALRHE